VAMDIETSGENGAGADSKHLRTGINSCLVDSSAVAGLLMRKGVFDEGEYMQALAIAAEEELATMTTRLRERTGFTNISFG
jgi:hypothetical protein